MRWMRRRLGQHNYLAESASWSPKRAAANRLMQYVAERREMIRCPESRAESWQIGSGPTEAECKTAPTGPRAAAGVGIPATPKP